MVHKENVFLSDFLVNKYDDICLLLFFWHDPYRSRFESDLGKQGDSLEHQGEQCKVIQRDTNRVTLHIFGNFSRLRNNP